jgi:methylase of polypeptide subunit release factors
LSRYFGKNSDTAAKLLPVMCRILANPGHKTTMLFREWKRLFEQVSTYSLSQIPSLNNWAKRKGIQTGDAAHILFALHTYYSIVVKLLTLELLSSVKHLSRTSFITNIANASSTGEVFKHIKNLENNDFYAFYGINNFLEGDFFSWYVNEEYDGLAEGFVSIARTLQQFEPATAKLKPEGIQDLLKVFYSSLVDEQIRHDLGEYYTPDWLAQYVLDAAGYKGEPGKTILDPACGSGTFLIECISKLRTQCEKKGFSRQETLTSVLNSVKGLDLNPLAVISARANYILAVSDLAFDLGTEIEIPIYLADSTNIPTDGKVDYIVGNPPWVRWSRLPGSYRKRVKSFCDKYGLVSGKSYTGGIESDISTVLAFSAVENWLKISGKIAILITWTVFKSGSARGFRLGKLPDGTGIKVERIENLSAIQPFPDATNETGLYLGRRVADASKVGFDEVPCLTWKAKKSSRIHLDMKLSDIHSYIDIKKDAAAPVAEFGSPLFSGSKEDFSSLQHLKGQSPYLDRSHRGTVNDLARVYWVKVEKYAPETGKALIRTLSMAEFPKARQVEPVDGAWIEADLLHPLLRGRETGRYCTDMKGWYQIIPNNHYSHVDDEDTFAESYPGAYSYLMKYQDLLPNRSTYKRYLKNLPPYCIYCIGGYSFAPYKVVWPEQQNPSQFRAAVIGSTDEAAIIPNKIIVPDHKLYFAAFDTPEEAHYLCAFLNSQPVRKWLGGFLLGKQIGTTIFEFMKVPPFDPGNEWHQRLVHISKDSHRDRKKQNNKEPLHHPLEEELKESVKKIIL